MWDFEEGNAVGSDDMYDVEWCSIDDVLLKPIVIKGIRDQETQNGLRNLVAIDVEDVPTAFVTAAKNIVRDIKSVPSERYPFRAIIKVVQYGTLTGFKLCSPKSAVTKDDERNVQIYKKNKFRK